VRVAEEGLMSRDWTWMDRYSAAMWNQIAGRRAIAGNYNSPENIGWFVNELLPAETRLIIVDENRQRLSRAHVRIYRGSPGSSAGEVPYGRVFRERADLDLAADDAGEVTVAGNLFATSAIGRVVHGAEFSNAVVLIEVERDGRRAFTTLPVSEVNYAVLAGQRQRATVVVRAVMR
jgi:hypothetical protein